MTGSHSNKYRCPNILLTNSIKTAAVRATFEPVARKTCWNQKWLTTVKGQLIAVISTEGRNILPLSPYASPLPASLNQFQAMIIAKRRTRYQVKYFLLLLVTCVMP